MPTNHFDVAIIGGGLAGLTLAIQLAKKNHSVILFEKEQYPFHKVCGEYISMESYPFLEHLGVPFSQLELPFIKHLTISSPKGTVIKRPLKQGGFGISRYTLDLHLANLAKKAGVTLLENTKVEDVVFEQETFTIKTVTEKFTAKIACGTFGKKSNLDLSLKRTVRPLTNYIGIKYHIKTDLAPDHIELHNFEDGYCGVSKVDGDKYCLCYLSAAGQLQKHGSIKALEDQVLKQNPFLKKYFTESEFLFEKPLAISNVTFEQKSLVENHLLLLGDAAGTIAPLSGNGMSLAMHASFIVAGQIDLFLNGTINRPELENLYQHQWKGTFSSRIKNGAKIQQLFGNNKLTDIAFKTLKPLPFITDALIGLTHGKPF